MAWIAAMTYLAKLLPYYGAAVTRSTVGVLWTWWTAHPGDDLSTVTLAPPAMIFVLLALFVLVLAIVTAKLVLLLWPPRVKDES